MSTEEEHVSLDIPVLHYTVADFNTGDTGEGESLAILHQLVQEILEAPNQNSGSINNDGTFCF